MAEKREGTHTTGLWRVTEFESMGGSIYLCNFESAHYLDEIFSMLIAKRRMIWKADCLAGQWVCLVLSRIATVLRSQWHAKTLVYRESASISKGYRPRVRLLLSKEYWAVVKNRY